MRVGFFGLGGHAEVVRDAAQSAGYEVTAAADDQRVGETWHGVTVGDRHAVGSGPIHWLITVGSIDPQGASRRAALVRALQIASLPIVHRSAIISPSAQIAGGAVILPLVVVNARASVGAHAIVNSGAIVEHDCRVGAFVHICPRVVLGGNVQIGPCTHIGIGATIVQGVTIGAHALIGAGTVVLRDVPDGAVMVGNPARLLRLERVYA